MRRTCISASTATPPAAAPPRLDRAPVDRDALVGDYQVLIEHQMAAQPGTGRARAVGTVEREAARREPAEADAAVRAGVLLRIQAFVLRLRALHAAGHGKVLGQAGQRVEALGREILKSPIRVASPTGPLLGILDEFRGPGQAAVLGLFSWVARGLDEAGIAEEPAAGFLGRIVGWFRNLFGRIRG